MIDTYLWLIPLLPWLAAAWIGLGWLLGWNRGEAGERETAWVAQAGAGLSLLGALALALQSLLQGAPGQVRFGHWLESGDFRVPLSFSLDGTAVALGTLAAAIGFLGLRFSVNYLHREVGFQRFFLIWCLLLGAMQWIFLGGNLVLMFVGWEVAGVCSYLLIAYAYQRPVAASNASRVLVTYRIGDAAFLLGIFLTWRWLGGLEWSDLASQAGRLTPWQLDLLGSALLVAALVKSAQMPFAAWISRALEGPTPSSAIFYGSLVVHAGVFLLIRMEPLSSRAPGLLSLILLAGLLTLIYGWLVGLAQADVKGALTASTSAQVGLMLVWCGLGWTHLAAWHLGLHAAWRAYQFLQAPAFLDLAGATAPKLPAWLAGRRWLHAAALHRFWLDPIGDSLLTRPTDALARDVQRFDERVVSRLVGLPAQASALSLSQSDWEGQAPVRGRGGISRGLLGGGMDRIADALHWFEERLILRGGGEGLLSGIRRAGYYANRVELLLSQPRYLAVLISITLAIIL